MLQEQFFMQMDYNMMTAIKINYKKKSFFNGRKYFGEDISLAEHKIVQIINHGSFYLNFL